MTLCNILRRTYSVVPFSSPEISLRFGRLSQRNIYTALYGLDIEADHDIARKAAKVMEEIGVMSSPGAFPWLARLPWLQFFPSWFPGCTFKRLSDQSRQGMMEAKTIPFDLAINNLVNICSFQQTAVDRF